MLGRRRGDHRSVPGQLARRGREEAGQQAQEGRLAAAVGAAQHQRLAGGELEAQLSNTSRPPRTQARPSAAKQRGVRMASPLVVDDLAVVRQGARVRPARSRRAGRSPPRTASARRGPDRRSPRHLAKQPHLVAGRPTAGTTSRARPTASMPRSASSTCCGWTNMPRTLVVWSARPSQPLMRELVRPQGLSPGRIADRSPVAKRISG